MYYVSDLWKTCRREYQISERSGTVTRSLSVGTQTDYDGGYVIEFSGNNYYDGAIPVADLPNLISILAEIAAT